MKHSFFYFLSSALIPELRTDIAAGTSCNVHLRLILIAAVWATPHKLAVLLDYLYFSVIAAHLAIIRLCIKLGVHNIVVDKLHYLKHRRSVVFVSCPISVLLLDEIFLCNLLTVLFLFIKSSLGKAHLTIHDTISNNLLNYYL